jgi:2-haloacid dehalogenase
MAATGYTRVKLRDFRVLTFDCYGTLIDWETGLLQALEPLQRAARAAVDREEVLAQFARHESAQEQSTPAMRYPELLSEVHRRLSRDWDVTLSDAEHAAFGASVPQWPAFADSAASLAYLKRHYRLVILSNVDRASFAGSNRKLGVEFDAICTAEDIGSYKPDARNFRYLTEAVRKLGHEPRHILHTAQSLYHDHAPAKRAGLTSAWIDRRGQGRGWGATVPPAGTPAYDFRFGSMAELVAAHEHESRH